VTFLLRPIALAVAIIGLASCVPPPPPPPPGPPPVPYAAPPPYLAPPVVRGCGPGRHWVPRHRTRSGRWVRGHCAWNR